MRLNIPTPSVSGRQVASWGGRLLLFGLLTAATQIGGVVYVIAWPIYMWTSRHIRRPIFEKMANIACFLALYAGLTYWAMPPLAAYYGRVPLPTGDIHPHLKPHNPLIHWLNRHYVVPDLYQISVQIADKMAEKHGKKTIVAYLEAGFPLGQSFGVWPQQGHAEGRALDLRFYYKSKNQKPTDDSPSLYGYGVPVLPKAGEENQPEFCDRKGFAFYQGFYHLLTPQSARADFIFDTERTQDLIKFYLNDSHVKYVFLEPHLRQRLGFQQMTKIIRHDCDSQAYDDHCHIEIY